MTPPENPEPRPLLERALLEYVRDPALWPVLAVVLLIGVTLGAAVLLFAVQARNPFALVALGLLVLLSLRGLEPDLRRRRIGAGSGLLLGVWGASAALAALVSRLGAF